MKLRDYLKDVSIKNDAEKWLDCEITTVTADSRQVIWDCLFVCVEGTHYDGHTIAHQALEQGAALIVAQRDLGIAEQILVENSREAYAQLCANHFGRPSERMHLIGVTGTNGKTTVCWMLKNILEHNGYKTGLIGTICNQIGAMEIPAKYTTPDAFMLQALLHEMEKQGCCYVVMEASSQAIDQERLAGCRFETAVFTNLSQDHLDYHQTMEHYFETKFRLFSGVQTAIINLDDSYGQEIIRRLKKTSCTVQSYSLEKDEGDYTAKNLICGEGGSSFLLVGKEIIERVKLTLPGAFSAANAMAALATAISTGINAACAVEGVVSCGQIPGRVELLAEYNGARVYRDYAHTPDGLQKVTDTLRPKEGGRLITLFGCGGNRDTGKRAQMGKIAGESSDYVILTSDNPRTEDAMEIIRQISVGLDKTGTGYTMEENRKEAIAKGLAALNPGDVLLLAGKGHEEYQTFRDRSISFDERKIVSELIQALQKNKGR